MLHILFVSMTLDFVTFKVLSKSIYALLKNKLSSDGISVFTCVLFIYYHSNMQSQQK